MKSFNDSQKIFTGPVFRLKWCPVSPVSTHLQQVFGGLGCVIKHGGVAVGLLLPILGPAMNNLDWFLRNFEKKQGKSAKNKYKMIKLDENIK